jgi:hypothetical protein
LPFPSADKIPAERGTVGHLLTGDEAADLPIVTTSTLMLRVSLLAMHALFVGCAE